MLSAVSPGHWSGGHCGTHSLRHSDTASLETLVTSGHNTDTHTTTQGVIHLAMIRLQQKDSQSTVFSAQNKSTDPG